MTTAEYMGCQVERYGPQLPLDQLVVELNALYHAFEARDYDARHPEITSQLPGVWREMISQVQERRPAQGWRILDFGCGTGFEAEQLLRKLPVESIASLTCYDLSPEMLARCRGRIAPLYPGATFCSDLAACLQADRRYDLLATNSLLHHLPDPVATARELLPWLAPGAVWLAGHEPSGRFYRNDDCARAYARFLQEQRWKRFLAPGRYLDKLRRTLGLDAGPAALTAREAHRRGLFQQRPSPSLIALLVDFHVAHSPAEGAAGRGLDFALLARAFAGMWQLRWVKTYSFMGAVYEGRLAGRWARVARELADRYPHDGANFSSVWVRS